MRKLTSDLFFICYGKISWFSQQECKIYLRNDEILFIIVHILFTSGWSIKNNYLGTSKIIRGM